MPLQKSEIIALKLPYEKSKRGARWEEVFPSPTTCVRDKFDDKA